MLLLRVMLGVTFLVLCFNPNTKVLYIFNLIFLNMAFTISCRYEHNQPSFHVGLQSKNQGFEVEYHSMSVV